MIYEIIENESTVSDINIFGMFSYWLGLVKFSRLFTNATENVLLARENDMAMSIISLNKESHLLEDLLLALELP